MAKKLSLLVPAAFSLAISFAQEKESVNNKTFHAIGFAVYTEAAASPIGVTMQPDPAGNIVTITQDAGFSYFSFLYRFRYNFYESNDKFAIAASITPDLGLAITKYGVGYINLPVMAELEFGAGSTYNSSSEKGGVIGAGIEANKLSLLSLDAGSAAKPKNFWIQPVICGGLRYWSRRNRMKEINLKIGFGAKSDIIPPGTRNANMDTPLPPITLRLSFITFLHY